MTTEILHCRFCAETKRMDKVLDLGVDIERRNIVVYKLKSLNMSLMDDNTNKLPLTVCFVCLDELDKASEFIDKFRRSQTTLLDIFYKDGVRNSWPDFQFEDCVSSPIKNESTIAADKEKSNPYISLETTYVAEPLQVKSEPEDCDELEAHCSNQSDDKVESCWPLDVEINSECSKKTSEHILSTGRTITKWTEYPWVCSQCKVEFGDMSTLREHVKMQHRKCSAFQCIDCNKDSELGEFKSFINHVRKHKEHLRKICPLCDMRSEKIDKHLKQHVEPPQKLCPACGELLPDEEAFNSHTSQYNSRVKKRRKRGTPITVEELTCDQCHKVYKNFDSLREHKKNMHKSERKRDYTCDKCGKTFYNKGSLGTHIMSHDMARPHVCEICNKSFSFPNILRKHMRIHSGDKPFSCEQCGKCFREKRLLKKHEIIHSDSMPFVCAYCSKGFNFKEGLMIHERQHTGLKPYSCDVCCRDFSDRSNYGKHMKIHHGIDTSRQNKMKAQAPMYSVTAETASIQATAFDEWNKKMVVPAKRAKKDGSLKDEVSQKGRL